MDPIATTMVQAPEQRTPGRMRKWSDLSPDSLWMVIAQRSDSLVTIGLTVPGMELAVIRGKVLTTALDRKTATDTVRAMRDVAILQKLPRIPVVQARLLSKAAFLQLMASPWVSFVEPDRLLVPEGFPTLADLGCGTNSSAMGPFEYYGGDILPWNYKLMRIQDAWVRSGGNNYTVGLIDTGVDPDQPELNEGFSSGQSVGRLNWYGASDTSSRAAQGAPVWADDCGHGTHMAGVVAAPLNGSNIVGVAHQADLVVVRHNNDIWQPGSAASTVKAIDMAAGDRGANIIGLAFMADADYEALTEMIEYWAYEYDFPKLFIGAAGSSLCGDGWDTVVHPASLAAVMAVSAVDSLGTLDCHAHRGAKVELVAVTNMPTTGSPYQGDSDVGESRYSSNAVALISGIAALAWSYHPSWDAGQIRAHLNSTGHLAPDSVDSNIGNGIVNALGAVDAFYRLSILGTGSNVVPIVGCEQWRYDAVTDGGNGPFDYFWSTGGTLAIVSGQHTSSLMLEVCDSDSGIHNLNVYVQDMGDSGRNMSQDKSIVIWP